MNIGATSSSALLGLNSLTKLLSTPRTDASDAEARPASSAANVSILPISAAHPLSFDSILALQTVNEPEAPSIAPPSATDIFLEEARKSPMERMREQILGQLGMTEESLAALPPDERRAAEDKIREMIEEKLRQGMGADQASGESNAAMLQTLA